MTIPSGKKERPEPRSGAPFSEGLDWNASRSRLCGIFESVLPFEEGA